MLDKTVRTQAAKSRIWELPQEKSPKTQTNKQKISGMKKAGREIVRDEKRLKGHTSLCV